MEVYNPTGKGIRMDAGGDGHHGAPRGDRWHDGIDFECAPGQGIYMPVTGRVKRLSRPYADDPNYSGLMLYNDQIEIKLWYFSPSVRIGREYLAGDIIGIAQNIGNKYPGVTPHVHLRVTKIDPLLLWGETL